ncbi:MAG: hypothetical protein R6U26_00910 [Candidatus Undinarchaeales archaeon]
MITRNTKGHFDPVCLVGTFLVVIFGGAVAFLSFTKGGVSPVLISAFAVVIIVSTMAHLFHHGFTPVIGLISIILVIFSMILLRGMYGDGNILVEFYRSNLFYLTVIIIVLDFLKTIVP